MLLTIPVVKATAWLTASYLFPLVEKLRLTQIKLPLNAAPSLTVQRSCPEQAVDFVPLGSGQRQLDFLATCGKRVSRRPNSSSAIAANTGHRLRADCADLGAAIAAREPTKDR